MKTFTIWAIDNKQLNKLFIKQVTKQKIKRLCF